MSPADARDPADARVPADTQRPAERLIAAVQIAIQGKLAVVELAVVAVIAGGHLLLEDVPGVGKTTLAMALARALGGSFSRIQFTSDLLPGDITGISVLQALGGDFRFRPGPLFANVVLADEINRASPKTQSALLESMSEGQVSADGVRHVLPVPFVVVATQNPQDFHGTFPLPDSQLDRFLIRLSMGYPDRESERQILRGVPNPAAQIQPVISAEELVALQAQVRAVRVHPDVEDYLLDLIHATRGDARFIRGVSPRGARALYQAMRALAVIRGRDFVIPEDLRRLAGPVLAHRVISRSHSAGGGGLAAIDELLWELQAPGAQ